jgi:hypothetical protein
MEVTNLPAVIKRSKTGLGLFASEAIPRGTKIVQYKGKLISFDDDHLLRGRYLIALNEKYVIDGKGRENLARYVNHCCQPNAYAEVFDEEIWIVAKRRIRQAEEITIDYGTYYFEKLIKPAGCRCRKCVTAQVV